MSGENEHRFGVSEVNLVVRHLKIEPADGTSLLDAIAEIDEFYGLDDISFDDKSHVLNIAYDASRLCLDGIEDILKKHGVEISHDWWTRFKEGYYKFVDQNIKDNSEHKPWSCHNTPPNTSKKR
ncbi:cation transporter [Bermanella sp. R86510]|uniref:cation transporter n=1 Tax=unclassified Bermanella TaxID=2627862 RepID=UPI0037C6ED8B